MTAPPSRVQDSTAQHKTSPGKEPGQEAHEETRTGLEEWTRVQVTLGLA